MLSARRWPCRPPYLGVPRVDLSVKFPPGRGSGWQLTYNPVFQALPLLKRTRSHNAGLSVYGLPARTVRIGYGVQFDVLNIAEASQ
jgi:hypothetical protein